MPQIKRGVLCSKAISYNKQYIKHRNIHNSHSISKEFSGNGKMPVVEGIILILTTPTQLDFLP
jgi:hypothetical protein